MYEAKDSQTDKTFLLQQLGIRAAMKAPIGNLIPTLIFFTFDNRFQTFFSLNVNGIGPEANSVYKLLCMWNVVCMLSYYFFRSWQGEGLWLWMFPLVTCETQHVTCDM